MRPFDEENHLSQDECAILTKALANKSIEDYTFFNNYATSDCKTKSNEEMLDFVLANPNLRFKDGYGVSTSCVIDNDSELRNNAKMTSNRERTPLCSRWYTAVPNLSRGSLIPNIESQLKYNGDTSDIRVCDKITEKDFNRFIPLPRCMAENVQNPENIIEKWTRGGDITRDFVRTNEYLEKCGFYSDGKMWRRRQ